MHVGYARVSTLEQDLSAQREALERLGVESKNIYFDHGLTGTTRARPGLREALAATARWVRDDLDLVLRVALVPMSAIRAAGFFLPAE